ncbi:16 kDa phloem protein 1-like [Actinidia eriantha]|uniref:16 kDa phloem protein 1-like n=1 Tax=Actinidia eriantha TaxID=165200 RepID=UPI00258CE04F|nr:16 kDa phloem protein 1-like [Actinidia eriantha]
MAKGTLEVLLVNAHGIKDRERNLLGCLYCLNPCNAIKMRPYVVVQFGNQESTSCVADQGEGKKLVWNEKITFEVEYPGVEDQTYKLILRIIDKHKISDDNFVGETTIYIKDVLSIGAEKGKAQLGTQKYRVVSPDNSYSGEISVSVTFSLDV